MLLIKYMNQKSLGQIIYKIKTADKAVWGNDGFIVETGSTLGKFFKNKKTAENWCKNKAVKFRLDFTIVYE